ncbi:MAG: hypothetical protein GXX93_11725 [Anaerolineae bacterium]|nr:hypothetical protein [Anaerolineae bacterium]
MVARLFVGHRAVARAILAALVVMAVALVPLAASAQESVALITSPQPGATVRDVVLVTGSALHSQFSFYKVEFAREPGSSWVVIGDTQPTQVRDGVLIQWDTRGVPDGSYSLRLLVVDVTGNYLEEIVRQVSVANVSGEPTETPTVTGTPEEELTATAQAEPSATPTQAPPTPTVVIEMPNLDTATPAVAAATAAPRATAAIATEPEDTGTGGAIVDLATGLLGEVSDAVGLGDVFRGAGSAVVNGALVGIGAFAVAGLLALVRQLVLLVYHSVMRR